MTDESLKDFLASQFPDSEFEMGREFLKLKVQSNNLPQLAKYLREDPELQFDYLFCLTGVDWPEHMSVFYHLKSTEHQHYLVVEAIINDRETPSIGTVSNIWRTAEFHEREAYDFYGIIFNDHPDLRRIFLDDDWKGWPMRKDYEDPINMIDYQ